MESLRHFAQIRLIVLDLDGTLVKPNVTAINHLILHIKNSIKYHSKNQVDLTLATGRTLAGVRSFLEKLFLRKNVPIILYNGSMVLNNGNFGVLSQRTISFKSLHRIIEINSNFRVYTLAYVYDKENNNWFQAGDDFEYVLGWSSFNGPSHEFNGMPIRWQKQHFLDDISPSAILIDTTSDPMATPAILKEIRKLEDISITSSGYKYIEVRPKRTNKGTALKIVADRLGLARHEVLALGDNDNDAEMLNWAGIGVSVAHASPLALSKSDYICRHAVAEGAVEVLRLIKHAKRYFFRDVFEAGKR